MLKNYQKNFNKTGFVAFTILACIAIFSFNFATTSSAASDSVAPAFADAFNPIISTGNGQWVKTLLQPDGKIVAVGEVKVVNGINRNSLARFNADGSLDTTFNTGSGANDAIFGLDRQPDGKLLVSGIFTNFNGATVGRLVRLNEDGTLDQTFNTVGITPKQGANQEVSYVKVLPDGKIVIGGTFTNYNGTAQNRLARLNADGSLDTTFTVGAGPTAGVLTIDVQPDGKLIIGGAFNAYAGVSTQKVARINTDGSRDTSFVVGTGADDEVRQVLVQPDGKILVSGFFIGFNGAPKNGITRLNTDGTNDDEFSVAGSDAVVLTIALLSDGKMIVGGSFSSIAGTPRKCLAKLNKNGTIDESFSPGTGIGAQLVNSVALQPDGRAVVIGSFTVYNGTANGGAIRINADGSFDTNLASSSAVAGNVQSMTVQSSGKIIIGGTFKEVNGASRTNIAKLNADGTLDTSFDPGTGTNLPVTATASQADGKILIGGAFSTYNGAAIKGLARLNADGTVDTGFAVGTGIPTGGVLAIKIQPADGKILVAGQFTAYNGATVNRIMRLNTDGTLDSSFTSGTAANGEIRSMVIQPDGKILIGGLLTTYNGTARNRIARLNADGTLDTTFNPGTGTSGVVSSVGLQADGKVLVGGNFTSVNGVAKNRIARFNADGTLDTTFEPGVGPGNGTATEVTQVLSLANGKTLIAGNFTTFNALPRNRVARLNANGSLDNSYLGGGALMPIGLSIRSLVQQPDGKILAGGQFSIFNDRPHTGIARFSNANKTFADFDADGRTDVSVFRPSDGSWWSLRSSDEQFNVYRFGVGTDKIVPGDYTGDGKTDLAVFREGTWFIQRSEDNSFFSFPFGTSEDIPAAADYDADGKTDAAVYRASTGTWYILNSGGSGTSIVQFGTEEDKPVAADFDGDGKADIAIFRPSDGSWWYLQSSNQQFKVYRFGVGTDKPVQGDYTGDGKADIAVFRPSTGEWFFQRSEDESYFSYVWGQPGDIAAPGDYDGDGKFDASVFRSSNATWYMNQTAAGVGSVTFGTAEDRPVPNSYVP
ncbi:MAG TPA: FG-GAP-like repeat-containing protein [Pyrinomonadaceae bacterium]|jgi:uncharacterized delta-60 repeat protein